MSDDEYTVEEELAWWKAHSYHPCDAVTNSEVEKLVAADRERIKLAIEDFNWLGQSVGESRRNLFAVIDGGDDA